MKKIIFTFNKSLNQFLIPQSTNPNPIKPYSPIPFFHHQFKSKFQNPNKWTKPHSHPQAPSLKPSTQRKCR